MFESAELCQTSMLILEQLNVIIRNAQQVSDVLNRENDYKIDTGYITFAHIKYIYKSLIYVSVSSILKPSARYRMLFSFKFTKSL